jgi:hypothetical protein
VGVDEGVDPVGRGEADAPLHAVVVGDRLDAELPERAVVLLGCRADHVGAGSAGELGGEHPDPAGGTGDHDGLPRLRVDGVHGRDGRGADDVERTGDVPVETRGLRHDAVGRDRDVVSLGGALVRHPDHVVADAPAGDARADRDDLSGEVAALAERRLPAESALADRDLAGIDAGRAHRDHDLARAGLALRHLLERQDAAVTESGDADCVHVSGLRPPGGRSHVTAIDRRETLRAGAGRMFAGARSA